MIIYNSVRLVKTNVHKTRKIYEKASDENQAAHFKNQISVNGADEYFI